MTSQTKDHDVKVQSDIYSDIDRQAAQLSGYGQIYRQLSRGAFAGSFTTVDGGAGAGIYVEKVNQSIEQISSVPGNQTGLMFLLGDQPSARFGSRAFTSKTAMLMGPGVEVDFQSSAGTYVCVVTQDHQALLEAAEVRGVTRPRGSETLRIDHQNEIARLGARVHSILQFALLASGISGGILDGEALSAELTTMMLSLISGLAGGGLPDRLPPLHARAALFREAREMIRDGLDTVSVTRLGRRFKVSRRTLEYTFQEAAGMTPHAYIAAMRMDAIRRAIKSSGDSIGDIAARYGIWHLGRFARQFRDTFGALPSEMRMNGAAGRSAGSDAGA